MGKAFLANRKNIVKILKQSSVSSNPLLRRPASSTSSSTNGSGYGSARIRGFCTQITKVWSFAEANKDPNPSLRRIDSRRRDWFCGSQLQRSRLSPEKQGHLRRIRELYFSPRRDNEEEGLLLRVI
ncbi:hypothetical protein AAC387_Pa09g0128 [Persea americana]